MLLLIICCKGFPEKILSMAGDFVFKEGDTITTYAESWEAKIINWNVNSNELQVCIENGAGNQWIEVWNYQHTLVGLKRGDYKLSSELPLKT
jgi:hypothetical protein